MGILRVDKLSGLETPTPVTGSVEFDGTGDFLRIPNTVDFDFSGDFTLEMWFHQNSNASRQDLIGNYVGSSSGWGVGTNYDNTNDIIFYHGNTIIVNSSSCYDLKSWNHLTVCRSSGTLRLFINGILVTSISDTTNLNSTRDLRIGGVPDSSDNFQLPFNGYISNLRVLKGTALYTSNFTPPTRELQPIGDTVLLCCNNSTSATAEATGKTITVNGNAAASTFSPGLVRDFTYGTQFSGVSRFDTQGYFVPPSGNTQNRYTLGLNEIVTSGLVLHLDAGNPFSYPATGVGTKWTDLSGNNNHGTLTNGVSYTENNRGALSFDGVDDRVSCNSPNFVFGTSSFTIEMWVYKTNTDSQIFFSQFINTANGRDGVALGYISGSLWLLQGNGSSWIIETNQGSFPINSWTRIVASRSYDNSATYYYINQQLVYTYTTNVNLTASNNGDIIFGMAGTTSSGFAFNGNIASTKIYNRALSAAEVSQNYEALEGRYGLP